MEKITSEEFKKLSLDKQVEIINQGIKETGSLKKSCEKLEINSKHWSEKFRNSGYIYSKVDKAFVKNTIESFIVKPEVTEGKKASTKKESAPKQKSTIGTNNTFTFYFEPTGNNKKIGCSVDTEVLKEFEKVCNKYSYVNISGHISNALALYVSTLNKKK